MKQKRVQIDWTDAACDVETAWRDLEEAEKDIRQLKDADVLCHTVGILMRRTRKYITVALSINAAELGPYMHIPVGCIKRISILEPTIVEEYE